MKNKCALLIGALTIISVLLIIPNRYVKASVTIPSEYQSYIDTINGNGFWFKSFDQVSVRVGSGYNVTALTYPFENYSWTSVAQGSQYIYSGVSIISDNNSIFAVPANGIISLNINSVSNDNSIYNVSASWDRVIDVTRNEWNGGIFNSIKFYPNQSNMWEGLGINQCATKINYSGTLTECFEFISQNFRNVDIYVDNDAWSTPSVPPMEYGIMNTNKGLKVNGADFSFYTSYTNNKFTIAYNYSLTNRDSSDSSLRIDAGDLLTFELYAKVPTKEFVDHYISQNGLGDATPSILIDVARNLKNTTNIINTSSIPTTTIYGLNYYGYNQDDAVVYDDSYYNFQYGNDQNGILTFRITSENNSSDSPNLLAQLVNYYGSEREAIIGSAMGYIDYCRSYVVNVTDNNWNVYNPYYTYFFQVKDESGRNVIRANSFEGTPQQFDTNDVENGESVGDVYSPGTNQSDIENSYSGGITNSYNTYINNYYNSSEANQELLDYLYRYRDGGQQEDIQIAYGYLNSTIDSVSNVPVVIGKLFYGFFPPQVILLFNAMFIIFAVFIIIKIIRHLFL